MPATPLLHWDIFCQVVDNYGDIGVCWRLAVDLQARGVAMRLWLDDASHLPWLAPNAADTGVALHAWQDAAQHYQPGAVLMATFGCDLPPAVLHMGDALPAAQRPLWLNIEHLSAEDYVARMHLLPSPRFTPEGSRWDQHFFYPGFSAETGGLLRETDVLQRQAAFDKNAWLAAQGIQIAAKAQLISLFAYEPALLADWLGLLQQQERPQHLLVCAGRGQAAFLHTIQQLGLQANEQLAWTLLPFLPQTEFDHLLWAADVNMVRGEDSWLRAIWAGKPFVWQIYAQDDAAHHEKLAAFMQAAALPAPVQAFWRGWNGLDTQIHAGDWQAVQESGAAFAQWRADLLAQDDLSSQLLAWVQSKDQKSPTI
jgi:uncharacterized repeat protein (TIGR03837 family)